MLVYQGHRKGEAMPRPLRLSVVHDVRGGLKLAAPQSEPIAISYTDFDCHSGLHLLHRQLKNVFTL